MWMFLVNNAGFGLFDNFVDFDLDVAKNMFEVNVLGVMYFTQKIKLFQWLIIESWAYFLAWHLWQRKWQTPKSTVYSANKNSRYWVFLMLYG